jgi:hypothetical protein
MTGSSEPWPITKELEVTHALSVRTLNYIDKIHIKNDGEVVSLELDEIEPLITALVYAKWYLETGTYNE